MKKLESNLFCTSSGNKNKHRYELREYKRNPYCMHKEYRLPYLHAMGYDIDEIRKNRSDRPEKGRWKGFDAWRQLLARIGVLMVFLGVLGGCYDYHEVESVSVVSGIGVMLENDEVVVHLELIEKGRIPSEGEGIKTILSKGRTFGDAIRSIVLQYGKEPYFGHTQVLIVDMKAVGLLGDIVDDLLAQKEVRYDLQLVVAENAIDSLFFADNKELRAFDLYELLKKNRYAATSVSMRLLDYMKVQDEHFLMPVITMKEEQPALKEGALLLHGRDVVNVVDAGFVASYLMLEGLFESSVQMIEKEERQIYSELNQVKTKYKRSDNDIAVTVSGRLLITEEDQDQKIKQQIETLLLDDLQAFLVANESLQLVDLKQKMQSGQLFAKDEMMPKVIDVAVTIDVLNSSNVRRSQ